MRKGVDAYQKEKDNTKGENRGRDSADSIVILEALEAVRKRPAMYIGSTGDLGLHHLVYAAVDELLDEPSVGFRDRISVVIHIDSSVSIEDNGRGMPIEKRSQDGKSWAETALTVLCCGYSQRYPGRGSALGLSVVNFLSEWLRIVICRDGNRYEQEYRRGVPVDDLRQIRKTGRHGTKITFKPDPEIFRVTEFNFRTLSTRLREIAALNPGMSMTVADERTGKTDEFLFKDGFAGFVRALNKNTAVLNEQPIHLVRPDRDADRDAGPLGIEIAIQYAERHGEIMCSFANDLHTADGGTHVSGFRSGLVRAINDYAKSSGALRKDGKELTAPDVFEGLVAAVSVRLPQPWFEGSKLRSNISGQVEAFLYDGLMRYFDENPVAGRSIVGKAILGAREPRELATR
jgi:DNA gyrase subunit B